MSRHFSDEWCRRTAQAEGDAEIGAGALAKVPLAYRGPMRGDEPQSESATVFGRFIQLMRRKRKLSLEQLAEEADIEVVELFGIEEDARHQPQLRAVHQLAQYFDIAKPALLQISGLTKPDDEKLFRESIRFAARSESIAALTKEEQAALEAFVAVLNERAN